MFQVSCYTLYVIFLYFILKIMDKRIIIFDSVIEDQMSRVRGIGRYIKLLKEALKNDAIFTDNLEETFKDSIFINPFLNFFMPPLLTKKLFAKQIAIIHDVIPLKYKRHFPVGIKGYFNFIRNRKSLSIYDLIITDSNVSKTDLIKILKIDEQKIKVVYPSLTENFQENEAKKPSFINEMLEKYIIYVGDATWNKNLINLAKAIKNTGLKAIFIGKVFDIKNKNINHPWQKDLKQFLNITKDDENYIFPGFVSDKELVWLYKNALLNMLVSYDEGFGFSFLEAGSQKTPSVLSDIPVFREIAQDNALFAKSDNWQDISEKIKLLAKDKNLRDTLGAESYERSRFFSKGLFKKNFLSIILS